MNDRQPSDDDLDRVRSTAREHFKNDREPAAIELLEFYLRYRPSDAAPLYWYGESLRIKGRFEDALEAFAASLDVVDEEHKPILLARLGLAHADCGRHEIAESYFAQSCERDPDTSWVWEFRGSSAWYRGDLAAAVEFYRKALDNADEEDLPTIYCKLGELQVSLEHYGDARSSYQRALEYDPESCRGLNGLDSLEGLDDALAWARRFTDPT